MRTIKTLSIAQPYAWATVFGNRLIHSLHVPTDFRGRLAIHASHSVEHRHITRLDDGVCVPHVLDYGCIIGAVTVADCVTKDHPSVIGSHWAYGPWCLVLTDPRRLQVPVKARGNPGFYETDLLRIQQAQTPIKPQAAQKSKSANSSLFDNLYA